MKYSNWFFVVAISFAAAACTPDKPASPSPNPSSDNSQLTEPAPDHSTVPASHQELNVPVPPASAQYTLLCMSFTEDNHVVEANRLKNDLVKITQSKAWYVIHSDQESDLYYGYYKSFDDKNDPAEMKRAADDKAKVQGLTNNLGDKIFTAAAFVPIVSADPIAPLAWEVGQCKGYWTLQVGIYRDTPQRKQDAVDTVRAARAKGIEAYYHHEAGMSEVFVGSWPKEAVKITNAEIPINDDPHKNILVSSNPLPGGPDQKVYSRDGTEMIVAQPPKFEVIDPTMKQAIADFPYTMVNGYQYGKKVDTKDHKTEVIPEPSFLIKTHPDADEELVTDPGATTPPPSAGRPSPEMGNLKSIGQ